jgi:tetratricopeptide (TPR) repeat protein
VPAVLDLVLIAAFLALTFLLGVFPLKDTDFWWHLRTGDLIRQGEPIPRADIYTFGAAGHPWIDLHWGFQVALSWGFARGGIVALNLAKCAITCVAVLLLITARRRGWPVWVILLAWLPALLVLGGRMYVRPETLTLLYLAIDLVIVFHWGRFPLLALLLPVVQVAWVNSQGLFVLGPIVLAFALVDALLRRGSLAPERKRWWGLVGLATFLTLLACLLNPYGLTGAIYPAQLAMTMGNPLFAQTIAELTPIPLFVRRAGGWHSLPLQLHLATMVLGALSFAIPLGWSVLTWKRTAPARRAKRTRSRDGADPPAMSWRLSPLRALLFLFFSYLSWQATRNSHQFAAVVGALTAWNLAEWAAVRSRARSEAPSRRGQATGPGLIPRLATLGTILALFALVACGKFYALAGEGRTIGLGEEPLWFPHAAVEFAGRPGMPERFVGFHDGYAAVYEYHNGPRRKVFVDARLEVMGADLYQRYVDLRERIKNDDPSWMRELDAYERPAVLIGHAHDADLGGSVLANPGWSCVWFDPIAAVYVHRSYRDVVAAHEVDFAGRHFARDPALDPAGIPALSAMAEALWRYATGLEARGRHAQAQPLVLLGLDHARRVRQAVPESAPGWKLAGKLEVARAPAVPGLAARFRRPFDPVLDLALVRATYQLGRALDYAPRDFLTLLLLENLFESRGMIEAAVPLLDRLTRVVPINELQSGQVKEAGSKLAILGRRLGPPAPRSWENSSALDQAVTALLAHGRARSAAEFLERAYPSEPRPWEVSDRLATLWLHLGEPARARGCWEHAAAPPGDSAAAAVRSARIGTTYLVEDAFEPARDHLRAALAADPGLFEAAYGLAVLEQDAGRAPAALDAARRALAAARSSADRSAAEAIAKLVRPYVPADEPPARPQRGIIRMKNESN